MSLVDWFLARSDAFKTMMMKFRDHKHDTIEGFSKVKQEQKQMQFRLLQQETRINQLVKILEQMKKPIHKKEIIKPIKSKLRKT